MWRNMKAVNCIASLMIMLASNVTSSNVRIGAIFPLQWKVDPVERQLNEVSGSMHPVKEEDIETEERIHLAFEFVISSLNQQTSRDYLFTKNILEYSQGAGSVFQVTKQGCAQLSLGVAAIFTSRSFDVIKSICSVKQMTNIHVGKSEPRSVEKDPSTAYTLSMNPSAESWNLAIADITEYYKWQKLAVIYCDDITSIKLLLEILNNRHSTETVILNINSTENDAIYKKLEVIKEKRIRRTIVFCDKYGLLLNVLKTALKVGLLCLNAEDHFIVHGLFSILLLENNQEIFGRCNITSLSLTPGTRQRNVVEGKWQAYVKRQLGDESQKFAEIRNFNSNPSYKFSADVALMYDALAFYDVALRNLRKARPLHFNHRSLPCDRDDVWIFGPHLIQFLKNFTYSGLTGVVSFDEWGRRNRVTFDVVTITYNGLKKLGTWKDGTEATSSTNKLNQRLQIKEDEEHSETSTVSYQNKSLIVTVIIQGPYVFENESANPENRYYGYCIDLLKLLAEDLRFLYNISVVPDNAYGNINPVDNTWDGMIGELLRGHADLAVAPLTINYDRERVVKFTKPYMSLGIGILYRTPRPGTPSLFAFLSPLSVMIWALIIVAYVTVAIVMFCIARLSPYEWQDSESTENNTKKMENNFGLLDSLWFGMGTLMQQGSDISPRSISTRLLAGVWWFFTLILISSYTANLAAFLTVTRMETDIDSVDDLAAQTKISYGTLKNGATASFFQKSMLPTFSKMWRYMNTTSEIFMETNQAGIQRVIDGNYAYLMESSTMEYVVSKNCNLTQVGGLLDSRGYGIATTQSNLRDNLSVSILKLQENGILDKLKHKWWKENAVVCPKEDTSSTKSLTVANLGGAFVFLCCGATVSVGVAVAEFFVYSYVNARRKKKKMKKEVKVGLSTLCTCFNQIEKGAFFDKNYQNAGDTSSVETTSCYQCSRVPVKPEIEKSKKCSQITFPDCEINDDDKSNRPKRRYCERFNSIVETVLTDLPQANSGYLATATDCVTSSLNSSKDPDSGVVTVPGALSRQACFQDTTLESDLANSSFSLPGGSPNLLPNRFKPKSSKKTSLTSSYEVMPNGQEKQSSHSNFRRGSDVKRWEFANSRSFRFGSQFGQKKIEYLPRNSTLCLEDIKQLNSSSTSNRFVELDEFGNVKQTIM